MRVAVPAAWLAIWLALAPASSAAAPPDDPGAVDALRSQIVRLSRSARPYLVQVVRPVEHSAAGQPQRILGTGISLGNGFVVTSAGAVGPLQAITVFKTTGDSLTAEVVGVDRRTNVAVLRLPSPLPAAPTAKDNILFPGEFVVAVGSGPEGGAQASFGTVLLADGPHLGFSEAEMLQVTAPAFPGITGGALLDEQGRMVGMVSGRMALSASSTGAAVDSDVVSGFLQQGKLVTTRTASATLALPVNVVLDIAAQLRENGYVTRGYLGLQLALAAPGNARSTRPRGVLVHRVVPGGPAATAGLLPGDLILDYAGAPITSAADLSYLVSATLPGSTVPVQFLRRGRRTVTSVHIRQAPDLSWTPEMDVGYAAAAENSARGVAPAHR